MLLAVLVSGALGACAGPASAQTGDCVERSGEDSYVPADCATAQLRVLERQDDLGGDDCAGVAGVTEGYTDFDGGYRLCLGPLDADPAVAVNVADVGDCLTGVDAGTGVGRSDVHQVDCTDPSAGAQVLKRTEKTLALSFECDDVPGSTATYTWDLHQTGSSDGLPNLDIGKDLLFCLGPAGFDPQSSPDTAQIGDCLRETGDAIGWATVGCSAPEAAYRAVGRSDTAFLPMEIACANAPGATSAVQNARGLDGYVLCLAPN
jgi:hypothetical protein